MTPALGHVLLVAFGGSKLDLHTIYSIATVDEQHKNEDKRDLEGQVSITIIAVQCNHLPSCHTVSSLPPDFPR